MSKCAGTAFDRPFAGTAGVARRRSTDFGNLAAGFEGRWTVISVVPARLGLKATALAWPELALAFSKPRPSQSRQTGLGPGLAWPRPRLLYGRIFFTYIVSKSYFLARAQTVFAVFSSDC